MTRIEDVNPQDLLTAVTDVRILKWGSEVEIEGFDDPITRQFYVLVFKNCTEIKWYVHELEDVDETEADLAGILLGKENYQEPAIITGFIFELWVLYESFELYKRQPVLSYLDE